MARVRRIALAALAGVLTLPLTGPAAGAHALSGGAQRVPAPPMVLPKLATAAATSTTWLVGTSDARAARRAGGRHVVGTAWEVPTAAVRALRPHLTYAEPNVVRHLAQRAVPDDPLSPASRWRDAAIDPALAPPHVSPTGPLLALVDAKAKVTHPEFKGANVRSLSGARLTASHGTETLGVAVAPQNGVGIVGAYPGARAVNVPLPSKRIRCADSARGIRRAVRAGAAVINMSYGSNGFCETEYEALQLATRRGITLVAAGGNERRNGNPYEFPASLPHVLTVGASTPRDKAAFFSNTSAALDLVAPGVGIIAPLPPAFDSHDGTRDGYEVVAGTSFSAPIVSAAAIWLRTARPDLTADQTAQVLRRSSTDIARKGYDVATGFGKLDLGAALDYPAPAPDPLEPNEDVRFVDGRAFGRAAAPIWTGAQPATLTATLDLFEDPSDVYRLRIPAGAAVTVGVQPSLGNPDVDVYGAGARTVASDRGLIARSRHTGKRTDTVRIRNSGAGTRTALVQVYVRGKPRLDAAYTLTVS